MKTLADGVEVNSRTWYYLLDFNDRTGWEFMMKEFNKMRIMDLTIEQYIKLWVHATTIDTNTLNENL